MGALRKDQSQLADATGDPFIGQKQGNVADVTASTTATLSAAAATAVTIAYGTDDPGITTDGEINIADGDSGLVELEVEKAIEELMSPINELVTLANELRTDHATLLTDLANIRTTLNAALDVLEEHGLMTAS